jgi:hypothetical protein
MSARLGQLHIRRSRGRAGSQRFGYAGSIADETSPTDQTQHGDKKHRNNSFDTALSDQMHGFACYTAHFRGNAVVK